MAIAIVVILVVVNEVAFVALKICGGCLVVVGVAVDSAAVAVCVAVVVDGDDVDGGVGDIVAIVSFADVFAIVVLGGCTVVVVVATVVVVVEHVRT